MKGFSAFFLALIIGSALLGAEFSFSAKQWLEINNRLAIDKLLVRGKNALDQINEDLKWLENNGYKNRDIAKVMNQIADHIGKISQHDLSISEYKKIIGVYINNQLFQITVFFMPGVDYSPFDVIYSTNIYRYSIENIAIKKKIDIPGTFHDMLIKYAFYGGEGTFERVAPKEFIELFAIKSRRRV